MQLIRLFSLSILFAIGLTVPAARIYAQQDVPGPTRLALEVTFGMAKMAPMTSASLEAVDPRPTPPG